MLTLSLTSLQGVAIAIPLAGGIAGSVVTRKAVKEWYPKLKKPSWTPPNWLFGPVWTYLYATMGYASHRIFQRGGWQGNALPLSLYAAQLGESLPDPRCHISCVLTRLTSPQLHLESPLLRGQEARPGAGEHLRHGRCRRGDGGVLLAGGPFGLKAPFSLPVLGQLRDSPERVHLCPQSEARRWRGREEKGVIPLEEGGDFFCFVLFFFGGGARRFCRSLARQKPVIFLIQIELWNRSSPLQRALPRRPALHPP